MNTHTLIIMLLFSVITFAQNVFTVNNINYEVVSTSPPVVKIIFSPNVSGALIVPSEVTDNNSINYSVTSIDDFAFQITGLTSVVIPGSIKSIGKEAFLLNIALTSVVMERGVEIIGATAFASNPSLIDVTIPDSVVSIGDDAFEITGLRDVIIPGSVKVIGKRAFSLGLFLTNVTINEGVEVIGENAFANNVTLENVIIPSTITSIEDNAFSESSGLTNITINNPKPISINANVFSGINQSNVNLHTPLGATADYSNAPVWQDFNIRRNTVLSVDNFNIESNASISIDSKSDVLTIGLPKSELLKQIEIYDLLGAKILTSSTNDNNININTLSKGMYIVKVITDKAVLTRKIIK